MALKHVIIDEFHLTVRVPPRLPQAQADAVTRTLRSVLFRRRLAQAVGEVGRMFPPLARVSVRVWR